VYNGSKESNNLVTVAIRGFGEVQNNDSFTVKLHRGYGSRKFWDRKLTSGTNSFAWGIDLTGGITRSNGYESTSYNITNPMDTNDYGNLRRDAALVEWKTKLALMECSTHASAGSLGWYYREYGAADDTNSVDELYDSSHREPIAWHLVKALDLDDINVAIVGGCCTADTNDIGKSTVKAFGNAGVDVVIGWKDMQYSSRSLFVKHFLTRAFQKLEAGVDNTDTTPEIHVSWTNYPTVSNALLAAYSDLENDIGDDGVEHSSARHVYQNLVVDGAGGKAAALQSKVYPPRYGADDR